MKRQKPPMAVRPPVSTAPWAMAAMILVWTAATASAGAFEAVVVDGVPHARNGARPAQGTATLRLEEQWRAGGEDDDVLFGVVNAAEMDREGNVYVLDRQLARVHVFAPDGRLLRTMGGEGDGPGEFRFPNDMVLLPDGRVGVSRAMPGSIVLLDAAGNPAGSIRMGGDGPEMGMSFLDEIVCKGDWLVAAGRSLHRTADGLERELYVSILDLEGRERARLMERKGSDPVVTRRFVERDEYWVSRGGLTAGRDGRVYLAPHRDRYAISVYSPEGKLERVIEREFQPRKRTSEEKDQVGAGMIAIVNGERIRFEIDAEDHPPCIQGMTAMDNGELWVVTDPSSRGQRPGVLRTYDVFAPSGEFVRQVEVTGAGDADRDGVILLGADRAIVVRGLLDAVRTMTGNGEEPEGEGEPLEVVCGGLEPA